MSGDARQPDAHVSAPADGSVPQPAVAFVPIPVVAAAPAAPDGWDARVVAAPGGNLLQGSAWAEHRRARGWTPWFLRFADDREALVLLRPRPPFPGVLAYAPRGPAPLGDPGVAVAGRAAGLRAWVAARGALNLVVDPVLPADPGYAAAIAAAGFRPTAEIQPSRHRMLRPIAPGATDADILAGMTKSARQRIRDAERAGTIVAEDAAGDGLDAFAALVAATAGRKGFLHTEASGFRSWWARILADGTGLFLVARNEGRLVGGLIAYRQGGTLATAFSADDAALRATLPGTMHALRFATLRAARDMGAAWADLGGADVAPAHLLPEPGAPERGLYDHKVSLGATWETCEAARIAVLRPGWLAAAEAATRIRRHLRR
ncbi:MAG: lipid II:glycine glycyltransferase FemX [Chloroflexota bacterium]